MSEKKLNFAQDYDDVDDPVGALAYTDFTKPTPVLEGEDAERFLRTMCENEQKAKERAKLPPTKEEIEKRLSFSKIMLDFKKRELKEIEEDIKRLEELYAEIEEK